MRRTSDGGGGKAGGGGEDGLSRGLSEETRADAAETVDTQHHLRGWREQGNKSGHRSNGKTAGKPAPRKTHVAGDTGVKDA
jgi:hypothetical protein